MEYIKKIAEAQLYNDGIGKVELWDFSKSNLNKEARIETISKVASLSYGKEKSDNPERLYKYLIEQGHESVFEFIRAEHLDLRNYEFNTLEEIYADNKKAIEDEIAYQKSTVATFKIKVPIFVARQFMRHRRLSYLEKSLRYTKKEPEIYIPEGLRETYFAEVYEKQIKALYNDMLEVYKPETARWVLPLSTYTEFWVIGNVSDWQFFFIERTRQEAQREIRELAITMLKLLKEHQKDFYNGLVNIIMRSFSTFIDYNEMFYEARENKIEDFLKLLEEIEKEG